MGGKKKKKENAGACNAGGSHTTGTLDTHWETDERERVPAPPLNVTRRGRGADNEGSGRVCESILEKGAKEGGCP